MIFLGSGVDHRCGAAPRNQQRRQWRTEANNKPNKMDLGDRRPAERLPHKRICRNLKIGVRLKRARIAARAWLEVNQLWCNLGKL